MTRQKILHEDIFVSCRVLAKRLEQADEPQKSILLCDYLSKIKDLPEKTRVLYRSRVLSSVIPHQIRRIVGKEKMYDVADPKHADIAVVTIKKPELVAAKIAFDVNIEEDPELYDSGHQYWQTTVSSEALGRDLSVVITMVAEERTVPCALACSRLFQNYHVNTCALVGIAAGLKGYVHRGDVVVPKLVWDYEGQRIEPTRSLPRPVPYNLEDQFIRDIEYYDPVMRGWPDFFKKCLARLKDIASVPKQSQRTDWQPDLHSGVVILAGEKLLANGSLPQRREASHERVRALEMEGSGFARACRDKHVKWLVFRGISDYGTLSSKRQKIWQYTSALSAATAFVNFLQHDFRDIERVSF